MIYGVFGGCYSDWYIVGYFNNRLDADKYCAAFGDGDYYVKEIKDLSNKEDLSKITLKYKHEVVFDFRDNKWIMREEPYRYSCYIDDEIGQNIIQYSDRYNWVRFDINIDKDDRKLAEKIAQDYLAELLSYRESKQIYDENIKMMNDKFAESFKLREKQRKEEELKQKELAELERLKEKYES